MIQNTCKLRTNNFSCDCCDELNCQRYIAYQQGREDVINELKAEFEKVPNRTITCVDMVLILRRLKELKNGNN